MADAPTTRLHTLLERVGSLFRASLREVATAHGLKLVQLEALIYLAMANRYSDTPAALTDYLGVTKGSVSQTLKALQARGLLTKAPDPHDRRVVRCTLTPAGRAIADAASPSRLLTDLRAPEAAAAADAVDALLRALQRSAGHRTFGACHTCRFFETRGAGHRCGLTHEPLSVPDKERICREHEPAAA